MCMPGEERSGEGLNHINSNMNGQGSKPHDQLYGRGGKVTLEVRSLFSQFCPLLGHPGLSALVTFYTWSIVFALFMSV